MTRPLALLGSLLAAFPLLAQLSIHVPRPLDIDAQNRITWRVYVSSPVSIPDLDVSVSTGGEEVAGVPAECAKLFNTRADCTFDLAAATTRELVFVTQSYRRYGHNGFSVSSGTQSVYVDAVRILRAARRFFSTARWRVKAMASKRTPGGCAWKSWRSATSPATASR
jgi:hypothetical protein